MDINFRPSLDATQAASKPAAQETKVSKIAPLTQQAALPILGNARVWSETLPFNRTTFLANNPTTVMGKIEALRENFIHMAPTEVLRAAHELEPQCDGPESRNALEEIQFNAEFGMGPAIDDFADALRSLEEGGK